ncbi:MAG: efflux RND transporter periplasmic adaptor subunit [Defluviitaleaceae bacterium]|nr:efflux RND transporter periplasmic adaptor subunit [Defluviitaleaceae bacterium]
MKFRAKYKITASILSAILLAGCAAMGQTAANGEDEEERVLVPVEAMRVAPQTIRNELTYAAQLTPVRQAMVMPRMQGLVSATFADVGDRVYEGDILFTMDERDVQNQIRALQAQHGQAVSGITAAQNALANVTGGQFESQIMQVDSSIENLQMQLETNDISFQNAMISYDMAAENYANISILYEAGAIARTAYDQARTAYDQAANALEQVRLGRGQIELSLDQAQRNRDLLTEQIARENQDAAAIGVNTAESTANVIAVQLANAASTLSDLSVHSPISGVVNVKNARTDEFATMATPAFVIIDTSSLNVEVRVSEIIINHINAGDIVDIVVSSHSPDPIQGVVRTVSPGVDHTNTFAVTIEIENVGETLRPGMFAEVRFVREAAHNAVVVPVNSILRTIEGNEFAFILGDGDVAVQVPVTTGISDGREIEILSGISVNDEIIIRGQNFVIDGEEVNVVSRS